MKWGRNAPIFIQKEGKMTEKEYLYVGHYIDVDGLYILKIGTTNDLKRRRYDHNSNYRKPSTHHRMKPGTSFEYDWSIPLSKYNTFRYEDRTKNAWKEKSFGEFLDKDRFVCAVKPSSVEITIRKTYTISL